MAKTDKQIISYIANKIWSFNTDTEEDIKDCIQEALNLKAEQYNQLNKQEDKMVIETFKDIKDALIKVPDEVLDNLSFGCGEGCEEEISMIAPEGDDDNCFPQVFDKIEKKYPQLNEFNKLIKNVVKGQKILDEQEEDKISDRLQEESITSDFFDEDKKSSSFSNIKQGCGKEVYPNDKIKCGEYSKDGDRHYCKECFNKLEVKQEAMQSEARHSSQA